MATPKIIADFETQLATAIAATDTSFTLASATDDDGVALPSGLYYFTVNDGRSNKEYLAGTLSGTSVTSVVHVSAQGAETSGANKAHRIGDSVKITDFATYKKYMDEIALTSAPDGDTPTKGVFEGATLAEVRAGTASGSTGANLAVTPDVLDDLPTQDEKAALAGASNAPDTSNKFVTEDDLADPAFKAPQVVTFTSSGTWTKDAGLKYVTVELVGGGGKGGAGNTSGESGGGGGGGGYSRRTILASALGSTETVTIGAGSTGSGGGTTSFGSLCSATGGSDGESSATGSDGGAGGVGSTGDINSYGQGGGAGNAATGTGGLGGNSFFGGGARGVYGEAGVAGFVYGGGGSGSQDNASAGGNGAAGIVIVTEYYS